MERFAGKVALVTGASSGIGKATMIRLAQEGAQLIGISNDSARLEAAIADMPSGKAVARVCDIADPEAVAKTVRGAAAAFGRIDVLVNSAGIGGSSGLLHECSLTQFDRIMAVNVRGALAMMKEVIPVMLAHGGGAIVNIASVGSFRATAGSIAYLTSKGAMLMMTRAAAVEYAKLNIRVNAVCPGTTATDMIAGLDDAVVERLVSRAPQGRLGTPEEVAALTAFLISDEAPHITGGAYIIDGGRCAT